MSNSNIPDSDPIIVAPTNLPVKDDDSLDYDALARNIEKFCNTALSGFVIGSYGGEEFHISEQEKVKAMKTVSDAHSGRKFVIGGIEIHHEKGAVGHSDADIIIHVMCDSILGALSEGDIGKHFPDTDEKYKGADSKELLVEIIGIIILS